MDTPPTRAGEPASANILVVDDVPANLQVLSGMLKERGYRVRPAPSGELALRAARKAPPDLILLDINMPGMNGYEVCQELKADEVLSQVPVIFISALNENLDKVKAFAVGGVDYLTKPFQMEELHARVETHLKLHRLRRDLEAANARLEAANRRMSHDLKAAARIQQASLPAAALRIPGVDLAWSYRPCTELAGDGLNIIPLGDGQVALCLLDVSGHGVSAALLSVTLGRFLSPPSEPSSILVQNQNHPGPAVTPPAEVADRLNQLFPYDTATEQFATLIYGVLDLAAGDFRFAAAGHPGPIVLAPGHPPATHDRPGTPIGLAEDPYAEHRVHLDPGDRLFLYSDGLPDAANPAGDRFGEARLLDALDRARSLPLADALTTLMDEITRWQGGADPEDDISILAIELAPLPDQIIENPR